VCAACCGDASCNDGISCTIDSCGSSGCNHKADASICPLGYQCEPELGGCVRCTEDAHCEDNDGCTVDKCLSNLCSYTSKCMCDSAYDCPPPAPIDTQIARPVPIGTPCQACIDGQCAIVDCLGVCCSSGCYPAGLCPD